MCTVSIIPLDPVAQAIRVVCNRDELRTRAPALPPRLRQFGDARAITPIDPTSGGTWIAVNDAGIVFTLLNYSVAAARSIDASASALPISRGRIIPALLHCESVSEATEAALQIRPSDFQPFRLIVVDPHSYSELVLDGRMLRAERRALQARPLLFTSSGLGNEVVESPRRRLFDQMFLAGEITPQRQDAFHRHSWPDAAHLSIRMSRTEARTVSRTTIELSNGVARMTYEPIADETVTPILSRMETVTVELSLRIPQNA